MNETAISRMSFEISKLEATFEHFHTWPPEVLMMACLREMDQLYVGWQFGAWELTQVEERVLQSGFAAIQRLYHHAQFEMGTPIFDQSEDFRDTARSCLLCASSIAVLNRLLRLEQVGLIRLKFESEDHISLYPIGRAGVEEREQRLAQSFWRTVRPEVERRLEAELGQISVKRLNQELATVVWPWQDHFIGYDSTPFLDSCFTQMVAPQVASNPLWHFLPTEATLGEHSFADFQMAAGALAGFALKHNYCVMALLNKNPKSRLTNLVSIAADTSVLEEALAEACQFKTEKAREILRLFMLERGETKYEYEPNSYLPPLIETSPWQVVKPSFTCLSDPFSFMLRKLSRKYSRDWDRAMNEVEAEFRSDLYSLFNGDRFFCVPGSINIRIAGRIVTDVDAAVFDRISGTLGLYQLKWQLPHWGSLKERLSKSKNFLSTGHSWVDVLTEALPQIGFEGLQSAFRIPARLGRVNQVAGFVLGRFFSEFGEVDPERTDGVTWGSWAQFVAARANSRGDDDTQAVIAEMLRQMHSSPNQEESPEDVFGDLRVTWSATA